MSISLIDTRPVFPAGNQNLRVICLGPRIASDSPVII